MIRPGLFRSDPAESSRRRKRDRIQEKIEELLRDEGETATGWEFERWGLAGWETSQEVEEIVKEHLAEINQ